MEGLTIRMRDVNIEQIIEYTDGYRGKRTYLPSRLCRINGELVAEYVIDGETMNRCFAVFKSSDIFALIVSVSDGYLSIIEN